MLYLFFNKTAHMHILSILGVNFNFHSEEKQETHLFFPLFCCLQSQLPQRWYNMCK